MILVEPPCDLPHRQIALDIISKDAPHDRRFRLVELEVRSPVGAARNAPISTASRNTLAPA
jgi:hypothetical protein